MSMPHYVYSREGVILLFLGIKKGNMATCGKCKQETILAYHGDGPARRMVELSPMEVTTYIGIDSTRLTLKDDDRVVLSNATVPHVAVCPVYWRERLDRIDKASQRKKDANNNKEQGGQPWQNPSV